MSVAERKAKEKEELRALILEGARKLFIEKGIEQTTIRNIADAINYSVGTVYVYFKDKNAILHALHTQGFMQLGSEMRVLFNVQEPMERLKALGRVYMKFALENRDMYDLMFSLPQPIDFLEASHTEEWNEGKGTFAALQQTVKDCIDAGYFKGHSLEALTYMIWSSVHGMCSLYNGGRAKGVNFSQPDKILEAAYDEMIMMIDKK
jgi:AcrR family transcriptional regulator